MRLPFLLLLMLLGSQLPEVWGLEASKAPGQTLAQSQRKVPFEEDDYGDYSYGYFQTDPPELLTTGPMAITKTVGRGTPEPATAQPAASDPSVLGAGGVGTRDWNTEPATQGTPKAQDPLSTGLATVIPSTPKIPSMQLTTTKELPMGPTATEALTVLFTSPTVTEALFTEQAITGPLSKEPTPMVALSMEPTATETLTTEPATTKALSIGSTATEAPSVLFTSPTVTEALFTEQAITGPLSKQPTPVVALSTEPTATEALSILPMEPTATEALTPESAVTGALSRERSAVVALSTEPVTTEAESIQFDPQSSNTLAGNSVSNVRDQHQELSTSSSAPSCYTEVPDLIPVKQCLLAILILALVATVFLVCTVVLAVRLSRKNHRYPVRDYSPTEMVCISSLLPDGGEGPNAAVANGSPPNAKSQDRNQQLKEARDGDDLTLHSFLP